MSDTFVAVSYCGDHSKSTGHIDGLKHTQMLRAVVEHYAPTYPVLVTATAFSIPAIQDELTRLTAWHVTRNAKIVSLPNNPSHQAGAAWCILQALEFGFANGYEYMIFTADDVVMNPQHVEAVLGRLREGYDYVGDRWGGAGDTLNTQVFGCRVPKFLPTFHGMRPYNPVEFQGAGMILEQYFWRIVHRAGMKFDIRTIPYMHTHDPDFWFRLHERMKAGEEIR